MNAPPSSLPRRIVRWFWVPQETPALDPELRARVRAARAMVLLGEHALARGELSEGPAEPPAALVAAIANFRAALGLALKDAQGVESLEPLLQGEGEVARAVDASERPRAQRVLCDTPLASLATQDEGALLADAQLARDLTRRALDPLLAREASRTERMKQRGTRITLLVLAIAAIAAVAPGVRRAIKPDLGPTSRWRASTTMGPLPQEGVGFHPREGEGNFFFQTRIEAEPWIEFDLGRVRDVEAVTVQNRLDCCQDWAVPLVIELGDASRRWREVGRRVESFYFYTAVFPRSPARYVRIRVPRMTSLHLGAVKIR